jgi:hypothetical protein
MPDLRHAGKWINPAPRSIHAHWITESLGLSPDGERLVLSESERVFSLMIAEGVQAFPLRWSSSFMRSSTRGGPWART